MMALNEGFGRGPVGVRFAINTGRRKLYGPMSALWQEPDIAPFGG